ncbi:MAG: DNA-directed DNA polymerase II small subunit [Candidatus Micrarchaeaceae archaeon]
MGELEELLRLLEGKVIVSAEISDDDLKGVDSFRLASEISLRLESVQGIRLLSKELLENILASMNAEKKPKSFEDIVKSEDFVPKAKGMRIKYAYIKSKIEFVNSSPYDFITHFNNRFEKLKKITLAGRHASTTNIENLGDYLSGREVSVVGMVYEKKTTKNGHVLVTLEDQTGSINVLFAKPEMRAGFTSGFRAEPSSLYSSATRIARDDVILVNGKLSKGLLIANSFSWPDVPVRVRKQSESDFAIVMISDVHVGSRLFLEKQFSNMLRWLNGAIDYKKELASKVKFAVFCGDLVDGIGVYPGQEKELVISDIYAQYSLFFEFLKSIPDHIEIFVLPGNHDAVRRADPQPELDRELARYNTGNVHLVTNPSSLRLEDISMLAYHGESLDSMIRAVPGIGYARPEEAMLETLKRRHLSSIYGVNPIVPSKDDAMIIEEVPDILLMGHIHKNGALDYHGTLLVNSGTWQARTSFQVKQGHMPSPAILPVYEAKTRSLSLLDFNKIA